MKTFALQGIDSIVSECMTIGFYRRAIQIKGKIKVEDMRRNHLIP